MADSYQGSDEQLDDSKHMNEVKTKEIKTLEEIQKNCPEPSLCFNTAINNSL